jgi:hypothetical protein
MEASDLLKEMKDDHQHIKNRVNRMTEFVYAEDGKFGELSISEQVQLCTQLAHMKAYSTIIENRIWHQVRGFNG